MTSMPTETAWMICILIVSFTVLIIGYNLREKPVGVVMMFIGILMALTSLLYKIYVTLGGI